MTDCVKFTRKRKIPGNILFDKSKISIFKQMKNIFSSAGKEVIQTNHIMPFFQEIIT